MKNPFTHRPYIADMGCHGKPEAKTICHEGRVINAEESTFVLHTINQHEKLVEMLRKQQRIMMTFCGYCGGNPCRPDCELAALLDEEKP